MIDALWEEFQVPGSHCCRATSVQYRNLLYMVKESHGEMLLVDRILADMLRAPGHRDRDCDRDLGELVSYQTKTVDEQI
jgi:hypothetical protein